MHPGLEADVMLLLEKQLFSHWNDLMSMNLPPSLESLRNYQSAFDQMEPQKSRQFLVRLKKEISLAKAAKSQSIVYISYLNMCNIFINLYIFYHCSAHYLETILLSMLANHGINKAMDIFVNIDFDMAYHALLDFQRTHKRILRGNNRSLLLSWENRSKYYLLSPQTHLTHCCSIFWI